jgi:hypothetical protein
MHLLIMLPQDVDGELVVLRLRIQALKPGQDDADGVAVVEICVLAHDGGITFVRVVGVGDSAGRGEEAAQHRRERPTNRPLLPHGVPRQCNRNHGQRGGELLSKAICSRQTAHRCLSSAFHPRLHKAAYVLCATVAIPFRGRNPWFAAAFRPGQGPRLSLVPGSWYAWPLPGWTLTYWRRLCCRWDRSCLRSGSAGDWAAGAQCCACMPLGMRLRTRKGGRR